MKMEGDFNWKKVSRLVLSNKFHSVYRDEEAKVQLEVITGRTAEGFVKGKSKYFYFIDNDPREFLTEEALAIAYSELYPDDDETPEQQVKYVKIITKRSNNPHQ